MAELYMYQQEMVNKGISPYVLINTKYTKKVLFFDRTTMK